KTVYDKPKDASSNFEHILYQTKSDKQDFCSGPLREQPEFESNLEAKGMEDMSVTDIAEFVHYEWPYNKKVKIFVVVDNNRYRKWDSNVTKTTHMIMEAISIVHTYFIAIRVKIYWVGLEIWTERDITHIQPTLQGTLKYFIVWRWFKLIPRVLHNIAFVVVGHETGSKAGYSNLGSVCKEFESVSGLSFSHEDVSRFASAMTHELGHTLGMEHDTQYCMCGDEFYCIMHESVSQKQHFSNCSLEFLYKFVLDESTGCLYQAPVPTEIFRVPICGNGILDREEECDCGTEENCAKDPCCLPTCRFTVGSTCAFGPCCKNCNIRRATEVCRPSKHDCDLPEYCNGTSIWCQPDVFKQDGTECSVGYCYEGNCHSLDKQCVEIFGKTSSRAPDSCYESINGMADRIGNCGPIIDGRRRTFRKCEPKDSKCGKLLCQNIQKLPRGKNHYTYFQLPFKGSWYWGAELLEDIGKKDRGEVYAGTKCDHEKICLNNVCSDIHALRQRCSTDATCTGRGMCNNLDHCHCEYGYAPPHCVTKGNGGSIDSGPPPARLQTTQNSCSGDSGSRQILVFIILAEEMLAVFWLENWNLKAEALPLFCLEIGPEVIIVRETSVLCLCLANTLSHGMWAMHLLIIIIVVFPNEQQCPLATTSATVQGYNPSGNMAATLVPALAAASAPMEDQEKKVLATKPVEESKVPIHMLHSPPSSLPAAFQAQDLKWCV
ncbi:disintegrin and metalloproteinase domain-containing protein 1a-like, partial [Gracilinanus agilis]|uniref:disintegrin and metalloproteinase domain-containing protein 1a-like n=1 Tax=Gracilinanus agilis TaxID=191870 RepID=UPI001CFC8488